MGFCSVPLLLQSVQRAEMWGVILALQSFSALHLGVDNLSIVRHVGRLPDGHPGSLPFELVKDGDLLLLIDWMLRLRGLDTVRISEVKGHADQGMVLDGRVRDLDRLGDDAADFWVVGGLATLSLMLVVICLGFGMVLHLILQYGLLMPSPRGVGWFTRFGTGHSCPCHLVSGARIGLMCLLLLFFAEDVAHWPYSTCLLVKWVTFSGTLHWPAGGFDLGVGGISYVELLILYGFCGWCQVCLRKRLILAICGQDAQFQCRLFLVVQALIFGAPCCLEGWVDLCPALLVLTTVGFVILVGRRVVKVSLQVLGKVPLCLS